MNNKVKFLRGTATEYEVATKDNDTFYYTTDDGKLYLGNKEITNGGVTIDNALSDTSKNPVQNKVINAALNSKADQTTVDNALAQKANSADVTASLAGKSDTGHTHDDRYYTESETNTLLGDKVRVSDFNSHTNNTTVHVTAEEKAAWDGKAELSDIPTTLPANGGNADTIDGKHAADFASSANPTISGIVSLTRSDTTTNNQIFAYNNTLCLRCSDTNAADKTYYDIIISPTGLYKEGYSNGTAISKTNLNDGGNADTLDGKHAIDFSQIINLGATSTDTKTAIGIQYKTTTYWCQAWTDYPAGLNDGQGMIIAVNYKGSGTAGTNNIWCRQIYISPQSNAKIYQRAISGTTVGEWTNIADGGNATTANTAGALATTSSNICLRNLSSGTAEATWDTATSTGNCPVGAWYGKHS